jgi:cell shape-determining protein MreC
MSRHANFQLRIKIISIVGIVLVASLSLFYTPVRLALTQTAYTVSAPFFHFGGSVNSLGNSLLTNFRSKDALVYENAMLRAENDRMQAQILDRNLLQERVMNLEEVLGRPRNDNRVVADVTVPFGHSYYDTLVIDAGADHNIQNGDFVVYSGAGVIGEVAEVSAVSAKVKLYSTGGEEHLVLIGSHSVPATARGMGNGNFQAKIPQGSLVSVGDRVVVSRGNLILGEVTMVEELPGVPFRTVYFRSSFNPTEVRTVEVVVGSHL